MPPPRAWCLHLGCCYFKLPKTLGDEATGSSIDGDEVNGLSNEGEEVNGNPNNAENLDAREQNVEKLNGVAKNGEKLKGYSNPHLYDPEALEQTVELESNMTSDLIDSNENPPEAIVKEVPIEGNEEKPQLEANVEQPPPKTRKLPLCGSASAEVGYYGEFATSAVASISVKYAQKENKLVGEINAVQDLGSGPEYICFHIKLLPQRKPIVKTNWESVTETTFPINFVLSTAKVKPQNTKNFLCIRLYGNRKKAGKGRCFAECMIPLASIMETEGPLKLEQKLHAKGGEEDAERNSSPTDDALNE